jgi:hypothetical protein
MKILNSAILLFAYCVIFCISAFCFKDAFCAKTYNNQIYNNSGYQNTTSTSQDEYREQQNNLIFNDTTKIHQPHVSEITQDDMSDYKTNKIIESIPDNKKQSTQELNKQQDQSYEKTENAKTNQKSKIKNDSLINSIDIEAEKIEISGDGLVLGKKSKQNAIFNAKNNVVLTTDNSSVIKSDSVVINSMNKTLEFKGNIDASLISPDPKINGKITMYGDEMVMFNSLDTFYIKNSTIKSETQTGTSYIKGDFIERNNGKFIISNSVVGHLALNSSDLTYSLYPLASKNILLNTVLNVPFGLIVK